jgi:hypothetical protein
MPSAVDPCLFIKGDLRVMLFVDDCLSTYPNTKGGKAAYKTFIALLQKEYQLQDDGMSDATAYLGMRIDWAPWVKTDPGRGQESPVPAPSITTLRRQTSTDARQYLHQRYQKRRAC